MRRCASGGGAMRISDGILYGAMVAPAALLFDRKVRREWLQVHGL